MKHSLHSPYPTCKCDSCKVRKNLLWLRQEMDDIYHRLIWGRGAELNAAKLEDWISRIKTMEKTLGAENVVGRNDNQNSAEIGAL